MSGGIRLEGVGKLFGTTRAVGPVSLDVAEGEFIALLGPSGCGKTTTLRMIAGFESPSEGTISIAGKLANDVPVERRGIGMVFQSYALFPHLTVFENVAFGLRLRKMREPAIKAKVAETLALVGLADYGARMPKQLSGGQQQRVSLARALAIEPTVLLLDEPLSNLDLKLREQMRDEIRRLQKSLGITAVYVTHDQGEAMALADRVAVMNQGRIEQIGPPREIYHRPATRFVAGFIGQASFLPGHLDGDRFVTSGGTVFETGGTEAVPARPLLVLRPETILLGAAGPNRQEATVEDIVYLGDRAALTLQLPGGDRVVASEITARGKAPPTLGDKVTISVEPSDCILVDGGDAG